MKAIAVFSKVTGTTVTGTVTFEEQGDYVIIDIQLKGLSKNGLHGFHVHEAGDLTDKCESMCAHFNPYNKQHGGPGSKERHVGDLGNLKSDKYGNVNTRIIDNMIKLKGKACIIGRGLIIHADEDDLGNGTNEASKINGNSGKRIACAIIGISKDNF
jgi:Cu-Zn family superoxide dismutase